MKLLIIHPDNPESELTWSRTPYFISKAFSNRKVSVVFNQTGPKNYFEKFFFRLVQFYTSLDYHYSFIFRKFSSRRLKKAINFHKPDAILHLGTSSAITFLETNVPNYLYCDNTWHILNTIGGDFLNPRPSKLLYEKINKYSVIDYHKFTAIFTQTSTVKKDLINYYQLNDSKVHVVGVGFGYVEPYFGEKKYLSRQILFVARNSFERKGGSLLVEAFKIVRNEITDATLILEGGGAPKGLKGDGIVNQGLSNKAELKKLYEESYILAMPSIAEPFGLVYLEALANNTAILGLNRGAIPDITQNGRYGFIIDEPTPKALADKLVYILNNKDLVIKKTKMGQNFVLQEYTWDKVVNKILTIIEVNNSSIGVDTE